jgi:hypothetical protein
MPTTLALQAGWAKLAEELAWLKDERFDLDLVGFDASEMERLWLAGGSRSRCRGRVRSRRRADQQAGRPLDPRQPSPLCGDATCWPTSSECSAASSPT